MPNLLTAGLFAALGGFAVIASSAEVTAPAVPGPAPRPALYVVEYDVGPEYLPGRPFSEQPGIAEHAAYMDLLDEQGTLILGGPLFDDLESFVVGGAMLVFRVESESEARRLAEADPALAYGLMKIVSVKPFMMMIGEF